MKERPILFSGAMVRAILELLKTQTRRATGLDRFNEDPDAWELLTREEYGTDANPYVAGVDRKKSEISVAAFKPKGGSVEDFQLAACPYGKPGDQLWVRETFAQVSGDCRDESNGEGDGWLYRASWDGVELKGCWKPSIHMPRKASRIQLEIVDISIERLQDISEGDAEAEGVDLYCDGGYVEGCGYRMSFCELWCAINGPESWTKNPWVWVVKFKRLEVQG